MDMTPNTSRLTSSSTGSVHSVGRRFSGPSTSSGMDAVDGGGSAGSGGLYSKYKGWDDSQEAEYAEFRPRDAVGSPPHSTAPLAVETSASVAAGNNGWTGKHGDTAAMRNHFATVSTMKNDSSSARSGIVKPFVRSLVRISIPLPLVNWARYY